MAEPRVAGGWLPGLPWWVAVAALLASPTLAAPLAAAEAAAPSGGRMASLLAEVEGLEPLRTVIVARQGEVIAERGYRDHITTTPTNIKSVSKTIVSALVGIAIDRGVLEGVDQKVASLLAREFPSDPDPRLGEITIGHLLSMQAGLARTSGGGYGRWVTSGNWVRYALAQPFADEPGGAMLYSTGSTHLLSAMLTRAAGRSTLSLARDWLGPLEDFHIAHWQRDPQGIYFGGNQMAMSSRSLLAFGELYRRGGRTADGRRLLSEEWIERSWRPRTQSRFTGDDYGYGWFLRQIRGRRVAYAWGYGGQMLYVVPSLALTAVMTSDHDAPSGRTGHRDDLHALMGRIVMAAQTGQ